MDEINSVHISMKTGKLTNTIFSSTFTKGEINNGRWPNTQIDPICVYRNMGKQTDIQEIKVAESKLEK